MKTRYPNVTLLRDRHGKLRARFRKAGRKTIWMKTIPDQPGFDAELKAIVDNAPSVGEGRATPGTVEALVTRYYRSADFAAKGCATHKRARRTLIDGFRVEFATDRVADFTFEHIEAVLMAKAVKRRDEETGRMIGGQVAATNLRKELNRLFRFAKKIDWIKGNPVEDAERVGTKKLKGFHTWSEEEIAQYQAHHALGTKARLALEIILWTGQRRGNAFEFGPKHIVDGKVSYGAIKGGGQLLLPVARDLRRAIDTMPSVGISTYLVTDYGKPFSVVGFGNKIRQWCDEAGLPQCTAHGLRKAIARRMAEAGMTDEQMMAVGGWKGAGQLRTYTEAADQKRLAGSAIGAIDEQFSTGSND